MYLHEKNINISKWAVKFQHTIPITSGAKLVKEVNPVFFYDCYKYIFKVAVATLQSENLVGKIPLKKTFYEYLNTPKIKFQTENQFQCNTFMADIT